MECHLYKKDCSFSRDFSKWMAMALFKTRAPVSKRASPALALWRPPCGQGLANSGCHQVTSHRPSHPTRPEKLLCSFQAVSGALCKEDKDSRYMVIWRDKSKRAHNREGKNPHREHHQNTPPHPSSRRLKLLTFGIWTKWGVGGIWHQGKDLFFFLM